MAMEQDSYWEIRGKICYFNHFKILGKSQTFQDISNANATYEKHDIVIVHTT